MSYAWCEPTRPDRELFYKPLYNTKMDLIDAHSYITSNQGDQGLAGDKLKNANRTVADFRATIPTGGQARKPFNYGEFSHSTEVDFGFQLGQPRKYGVEEYFHNYEVSFHNELWSGAFSGRFATGTTWNWERVFWWKNALSPAPFDPNNTWLQGQLFSAVLGGSNNLDVGLPFGIPVKNRPLHHHFKPLADLLTLPGVQAYDPLNQDYSLGKAFDESSANELEAYYLMYPDSSMAMGWVHNRNAWVRNTYYLANTDSTQNYLGCTAPDSTSIRITGLWPSTDYHINWFPTWMNSEVLPLDTVWTTDASGGLRLDLSTAPFGGVDQLYLDTLRQDYAFVVTVEPLVKSWRVVTQPDQQSDWDFDVFPNPANEAVTLHFTNDTPKGIILLDLSGRRLQAWSGVSLPLYRVRTDHLAKGAYWVQAFDGTSRRTKKLIIH